MTKMTKRLLMCLLVAAVATFGVACGDDNGGSSNNGSSNNGTGNNGTGNNGTGNNGTGNNGSSSFSSSLDGSAELGSLSQADKDTLCEEYQGYAMSLMTTEEMCTMLGLVMSAFSNPQTDAELQTACAQGRDSCLDDPQTDDTCDPIPSDCTATVDELEACLDSQAQEVAQTVSELPACEEAAMSDLEALGDSGSDELSPECQTVEDKCPGMMTDDGSSDPGTGTGG